MGARPLTPAEVKMPPAPPAPENNVSAAPERRAHPFIQGCGAMGFLFAKGLAHVLPQGARYALARFAGRVSARLFKATRLEVQANLRMVLGPGIQDADLEKKAV